MSNKTRKTRGRPVPPSLLAALRLLLHEQGEAETLRRLQVSHNALWRALAGMPVLLGTAALIERGLERQSHPPVTPEAA